MKLILCFAVVLLQAIGCLADCDIPAFIGVAKDGSLMTRGIGFTGQWREIKDSCCVTRVAVMKDCSLIGVGEDGALYTKTKPGVGKWTGPIEDSCCVQDVEVMPDGTIVAITNKKKLVYRETLESPWKTAKRSNSVIRVDALPDGKLVGVTPKGTLKIRDGLKGNWKFFKSRLFNSDDIAVQPDGKILGIKKKACSVHLRTDRGSWTESIGDDQCVISITSAGNMKNLEIPEPTEAPVDPVNPVEPTEPVQPPPKPLSARLVGLYGLKYGEMFQYNGDGSWSYVDSNGLRSVAPLKSGAMYGVSQLTHLGYKPDKDSPWQLANDPCCTFAITVLADGTIMGQGNPHMNSRVGGIDGTWSPAIAGSEHTTNIAPLPDGGMLGVRFGKLVSRPGIEGVWTEVASKNLPVLKAVAADSDGTVAAIDTSCGLWAKAKYDDPEWLPMENSSKGCMSELAFAA